MSAAGQAPIGVRNISQRVGGSHSQVMETKGQFHEKRDILMDPITIPASFLKQSARVPVTETAGSLEAYVEDMLRFVEDMERAVKLGGNDVMSLDRPRRSRLRQPETNIKKKR